MTRVAINGFGRIGRCSFKQFIEDDRFEIVGINDLDELDELAYLLKYDSVHGWYPRKVSTSGSDLIVDDSKVSFTQERDPSKLPWGDLGVDVVIESTGAMRSREDAAGHLEAGASRVVISYAPEHETEIAAACKEAGVPFMTIGTVGGDRLVISGLVDVAVTRLSDAWRSGIPSLMKKPTHL